MAVVVVASVVGSKVVAVVVEVGILLRNDCCTEVGFVDRHEKVGCDVETDVVQEDTLDALAVAS